MTSSVLSYWRLAFCTHPPQQTKMTRLYVAGLKYTFTNSLRNTYAIEMTMKSSQFHGSLRNVKLSVQNPRAVILTSDSKV